MGDFITQELFAEAREAVRKAGKIILAHREKPKNIRYKGRVDLVTDTDVAVENALKEALSRILPGASFLAEESAEETEPGDLTWIIDPLDGTTNFAHDLPMVAISVALWREGQVDMGIIHLPVLDEMFYAARGQGAYLNGKPISVSQTTDPEKALVATGFPYAIRENIRPIMENLENVMVNCQGVRRMGSAAVDLAYTALGRFDAFFEAMLHPWDVAAGWLLVLEAGGRVSQYDYAKDFNLNAKTILAGNETLQKAISHMLRKNP